MNKFKIIAALFCLTLIATELCAQQKPVLLFKKDKHDFGTVPRSKSRHVKTVFEFQNTSEQPILINKVTATCSCTSAEWTRQPVLKGKKGSVTIIIDLNKVSGSFTKNVFVQSNAKNDVEVLKVTGTVTN